MKNKITLDYNIIFPQESDFIFNEVLTIIDNVFPDYMGKEINILKDSFWDTVRIFKGQYPGYKACNTQYHDLNHTLSVYLSTARLLSGAILSGETVKPSIGILGLIASLFHDIGLIQTVNDNDGTGAKYTIGHEERSIEFMKRYLKKKQYDENYIEDTSQVIACTIMSLKISSIIFRSKDTELMGKIIGTADLYTQLADRLYLEKLLYLYKEFKEGGISTFDTEFDLLQSTESFYKNSAFKRFDEELGKTYKFMRLYFKSKWGIDRDYYMDGIKKNIEYLTNVVLKYRDDYRKMLRRAGITTNLDKS